MTLPQAFQQVRRALDSAGVIYAIGGSWASTIHGEPRHTNDIDFVINLDSGHDAGLKTGRLQRFFDALGSGFYFDLESAQASLKARRPFNIIHQDLGYKFDFFQVFDGHGMAELARRMAVALPALDSEPVPVISAEDTILAKLRWYRAGGLPVRLSSNFLWRTRREEISVAQQFVKVRLAAPRANAEQR